MRFLIKGIVREDDAVVDTDLADEYWNEHTYWDGRNHVSVNTGSQWAHETLYRSKKGRYYIVSESDYQGSVPSARWVSPKEAANWLLMNRHQLPEDLSEYGAE